MARTGYWLSIGWHTVMSALGPFMVVTLVCGMVMGLAGSFGEGVLVAIVSGPIFAGLYAVMMTRLRTGRLDFNQLRAATQNFVQAMLAFLVVSLFVTLGLAFVIIPGILMYALYLFPLLLIVDRKMSFWEAMEESRMKAQQDFAGFTLFAIAIIGINLLGLICFGLGLLVTIPVTMCAVAAAYEELWPRETVAAATEAGAQSG
jgi:uncharacterized membrane protein